MSEAAWKLYLNIFYDSGFVKGDWEAIGTEIVKLIDAVLEEEALKHKE